MQWFRRPALFNGAGWGFGDVALEETTLQQIAAASERREGTDAG
jgi:hypothetical protein